MTRATNQQTWKWNTLGRKLCDQTNRLVWHLYHETIPWLLQQKQNKLEKLQKNVALCTVNNLAKQWSDSRSSSSSTVCILYQCARISITNTHHIHLHDMCECAESDEPRAKYLALGTCRRWTDAAHGCGSIVFVNVMQSSMPDRELWEIINQFILGRNGRAHSWIYETLCKRRTWHRIMYRPYCCQMKFCFGCSTWSTNRYYRRSLVILVVHVQTISSV